MTSGVGSFIALLKINQTKNWCTDLKVRDTKTY
jgi:hypothetical protein